MAVDLNPAQTQALVVGVEKYAAGDAWNLNGPAQDAGRFTRWLLDQKVPPENIALFSSALDEAALNEKTGGLKFQPASHQNIYHVLTSELPQKKGDLLFVFWGGHGIITPEGNRRLFYADANSQNMKNLDLNRLFTFLRSDYFAGFERQIWIVDACANYIYDPRQEQALPLETFPTNAPRAGVEQFIFLAAKAGEVAKNLDSEKTGLFSKAILDELFQQPGNQWPPDLRVISSELEQKFVALREQGEIEQTPVHFWYKDWQGNEHTLSEVKTVSPAATQAAKAAAATTLVKPWRRLTFGEKTGLVDKLLDCPSLGQDAGRRAVLSNLRGSIKYSIPENPAPKAYVVNIVSTCENFSGGLQELLEIIEFYDGETTPLRELVGYFRTLNL